MINYVEVQETTRIQYPYTLSSMLAKNPYTTYASSLAIKTDGALWSWGNGAYGVNALGNQTSYSSPKQVGALTRWSKIDGGRRQVLAIIT